MSDALAVLQLLSVCVGVYVWWRVWARPGQASASELPHSVDVAGPRGQARLGELGRVTVQGAPDGAATVVVDATGVVAYDLWGQCEAGWVQLYPTGQEGVWRSHLLQDVSVQAFRVWVDRCGDAPPNTGPSQQAAAMLAQGTALLSRRLPNESASETPRPPGVPTMVTWARTRRKQEEVAGALEKWTEAAVAASGVGWPLGIPTGDSLLQAWARSAPPSDRPDEAFARWLCGQLGRAARAGLTDRLTAEHREVVSRVLHDRAARLVAALDAELRVDPDAPGGVGPRQRGSWLVDDGIARLLENQPVGGVLAPLIVLRPALCRGDEVLLPGEVA